MQITIKNIAAHAGISFQTVSRILNGKGEAHSQETRERVLAAAQELGYRKHSSAKAMRHGRFDSVALLLSEIDHLSLLSLRLRVGIMDELATHEQNLILARLPDVSLTSAEKVPRILRELTADGLLINYNDAIPAKMIELITTHRMPAIWINSLHDADCVFPDDREAARIATRHLIANGHQKISYLHWSASHYSNAHRQQGYTETMEQAHFETRSIMTFDIHKNFASLAPTLTWLLGQERCTAFVCYSPEVATQLFYLSALVGLRIPDDFSLVTFADAPHTHLNIQCDTAVLPYYEMGQEAVRMLMEKIDDPAVSLEPRILLPTLQTGATVRTL